MYKIDFQKPSHIHFIGIGGISMSGLAEILLDRHFTVSGSDWKRSDLTDHLASAGAAIMIGQRKSNLSSDIDVVVYTAAVHPDNEELTAAQEMGLPLLTRAQLLGQLMTNYKTAIAVSGTHGKTTTTSMLTEILLQDQADPTISVGGILDSIGGNIRVGASNIFVTEACEYTNSFLSFFPTVGIILNVEADHLDFFKDLQDIRHSFHLFAQEIANGGLLIINRDIDHYEELTKDLTCRVVTYGSNSDSDYTAINFTYDQYGHGSYDLVEHGKQTLHIKLSVPGEHNIFNSLAAIAAAREEGICDDSIVTGLASFGGTKRRFEYKGKIGDVTIIDDYAHHPTEIKATLTAARNYPHDKIWCVFQPHTYSRTKSLMGDFAASLALADYVVLADIYAARETDHLGISSKTLMEEVKQYNPNVYYFPSFDEIENFLLEHCTHNDLLITMGAGDIVKVGEHLLGN